MTSAARSKWRIAVSNPGAAVRCAAVAPVL